MDPVEYRNRPTRPIYQFTGRGIKVSKQWGGWVGLCRRRRRRLGGGGYGRLSCISKFVLHIITAIITKYYSSFNPVLNRRLHFYSLSVGLFATGCSKCYFTTDKLAKFSFYICVNVLIRFFYLLVRILVACLFHSLLFVFFFYKSIYLKKKNNHDSK